MSHARATLAGTMKSSPSLPAFVALSTEKSASPLLRRLVAVGSIATGTLWSVALGSPLPLIVFVALALFTARLTKILGASAAAPRRPAPRLVYLNACSRPRPPSRPARLLVF